VRVAAGFIGFGGLARSLRPLLAPFGCPIRVYDPWVTESALRRQGCEPMPLDELLPQDHPIRRALGVILSAHRAGSVPEGLQEIGRAVVDDLEAILAGLPPSCMQQAQPELIQRR
jgi:phosphoglycerate dehydrogenase-like enzyme